LQEAFEAARTGDVERLDALLAADPSLAAARNDQGLSILMQALYHQQAEAAQRLLRAEPALDLFEAAAVGRTDRIEELARQDPATAVAFAPDGFTALHFAAFFAQPAAVEAMLRHGARVNAVSGNPSAVTPLHSAVAGASAEAVAFLLAAGAEVDARQAGGFTPLMGAAFAGLADVVEQLLAAGADPALSNDEGKTAADLAAERGHSDLEARLR
jgi:ankyrin repeat protein